MGAVEGRVRVQSAGLGRGLDDLQLRAESLQRGSAPGGSRGERVGACSMAEERGHVEPLDLPRRLQQLHERGGAAQELGREVGPLGALGRRQAQHLLYALAGQRTDCARRQRLLVPPPRFARHAVQPEHRPKRRSERRACRKKRLLAVGPAVRDGAAALVRHEVACATARRAAGISCGASCQHGEHAAPSARALASSHGKRGKTNTAQ